MLDAEATWKTLTASSVFFSSRLTLLTENVDNDKILLSDRFLWLVSVGNNKLHGNISTLVT